ncbi:MAG: HEAT repeat domain-containing protein [Deltaproteobacteria bacterium]|nr:HEAT repeat domain-containing protein [Deltaproteobacteria bacterium]
MPGALLPHARIREVRDRSWTRRLVAAMPAASDDELDAIATSLMHLEDPRAIAPLTAMMGSPARAPVRATAGAVLRSIGASPTDAQLRAWWRGPDPLCQHHALLSMTRGQADVVADVADDPAHPLHRDAIDVMEFGFEEPAHQARKIAALAHPDPEVRATAATILAWDEPLAAEPALIRCAQEDEPGVAAAAAQTLGYYGSRCALRCLGELRPEVLARLADAPQRLDEVAAGIADAVHELPPAARGRVLSWLHPVWELVADAIAAFQPVAAAPPTVTFPTAARTWTVDEVLATYGDLDGAWIDKLAWFPAATATATWPSAARRRVALLLANHADPAVRAHAAGLFAAWGEGELVIAMLRDDAAAVRKAAAYHCAQLAPDPALSPVLWRHLHDPATASTHARETLASWAVHVPARDAIAPLVALVREDPRESVRVRAVEELGRKDARDALRGLGPLLADAPRVTWAVHLAILEESRTLGIDPGPLAMLDEVDSLDVQLELARHGR